MKYLPAVMVILTSALADTRYGRFWPEDLTTTPDDEVPNMAENLEGNGTRGIEDPAVTTTAVPLTEPSLNQIPDEIGDFPDSGLQPEAEPSTSTTTTTTPAPTRAPSPAAHRRTSLVLSNQLHKRPLSHPTTSGDYVQLVAVQPPQNPLLTDGARPSSHQQVRNRTTFDLQTTSLRARNNNQAAAGASASEQNTLSEQRTASANSTRAGRTRVAHPSASKKYFNDLEYRL